MKKSYHSTVVPTIVAKTTRRRSTDAAMVPVGVKPSEDCGVLMCVTPVSVRDVVVSGGADRDRLPERARSYTISDTTQPVAGVRELNGREDGPPVPSTRR